MVSETVVVHSRTGSKGRMCPSGGGVGERSRSFSSVCVTMALTMPPGRLEGLGASAARWTWFAAMGDEETWKRTADSSRNRLESSMAAGGREAKVASWMQEQSAGQDAVDGLGFRPRKDFCAIVGQHGETCL